MQQSVECLVDLNHFLAEWQKLSLGSDRKKNDDSLARKQKRRRSFLIVKKVSHSLFLANLLLYNFGSVIAVPKLKDLN